MEKTEREIFEYLYDNLNNMDKIMRYFNHVKIFNESEQREIYERLVPFLNEKKNTLIPRYKYDKDVETKEKIKQLNYFLHLISINLSTLPPVKKEEIIKKEEVQSILIPEPQLEQNINEIVTSEQTKTEQETDPSYTIKQQLLKALKQKKKYSYNELKEILYVATDDKMFEILMKVLEDSLNSYNIETPIYYHKYIIKILEYLRQDIDKLEISNKENLYSKLHSLEYSTSRILNINYEVNKSKLDLRKPVCLSNKSFLLNILNELKHIQYNIKGITGEKLHELHYEILSILDLCIFELKNYECIKDIIKYSSNIALDETLVKKILRQYKNTILNSKIQNDIIYYYDLVQLFAAVSKEENNTVVKMLIMNEIKDTLSLSENDTYSSEKKEQIRFFSNELLTLIDGKYKSNMNLYNLQKKYNLSNETQPSPKDNTSWKLYKLNTKPIIITIDHDNAKNFENAISLESFGNKYHLGYYISDITAYTEENKKFEQYIMDKGFSIKGFPLIPNKFMQRKLSLQKGKYRKVVAFEFTLNDQFQVINFKVERQRIKVKYNLKFSDIQPILESGLSSKLKKTVSLVAGMSHIIETLNQNTPEYHEMKEINREILYDIKYTKNDGSRILSAYQIFLNSFMAKLFVDNGYPYLYRNNEFSHNIDTIDEIKKRYNNNSELEDIINLLSNIYIPSVYSTDNKGHEGLNQEAYGEVSKPCRSAASYLNLKQVIEYYINGRILTDEEKENLRNRLNKQCNELNQKRILYDEYLKEAVKIKRKG